MDGITLDHLIAELRPALLGRHLGRPRAAGLHAVVFELSGDRSRRVWLDAARPTAGLYLLRWDDVRALEVFAEGAHGRARQALLLLRKHMEGRRVTGLERIPGERTIVLEAGDAQLALRLSGPAPALTLVLEGRALATLGEGPEAWPPPPPRPEVEWDRVDAGALAAAAEAARETGKSLHRGLLAACPPLGPLLARELDGSAESLERLRARLAGATPTLLAPAPLETCCDADLAGEGAVLLAPLSLERPGKRALHPPSWTAGAALFLRARRRGTVFERRRGEALAEARRELRHLVQLEAHLARDLARLPDSALLRRQGEALLASMGLVRPGAAEIDLPDPYDEGAQLRILLDPALPPAANADRVFRKARRIERSRKHVEARLAETGRALEEARSREAHLLEARNVEDLGSGPPAAPRSEAGRQRKAGPRQYLTSRGLTILVGRGARENHHLTFGVARPDDLWLHARDVPGGHVILRDNEGRARADDLREAAEVAAFFSEARSQAQVDVHVARRKQLRSARGAPGRVVVGHSDTVRVTPRDPEGRLRRR